MLPTPTNPSSPEDENALTAKEEAIEEESTDRLLFLSDGVFAIVITLLILEIKVPHPPAHRGVTLMEALRGFLPLWPSLLGYVLSFVTIAIMWANHCVLFRYIKKSDHTLTVLNLFLLLVVAFIPFATAVLADYLPLATAYQKAAVIVYTGVNFLMALSFNLLWRYASQDNRLLDTTVNPELFERVHRRYRLGPLVYFICFTLSFVSVPLTLSILGVLGLVYALPYGKEARAVEERFRRFRHPKSS